MANQNQQTFVFEVCGNCSSHQWNTRHDEAKYAQFFADVSANVKSVAPNANCIMNRVPKAWYEKEIYCQLVPNEDDNNPYYDIIPRIGAFEVSIVHDNIDILLYSKMMSTMWPHAPSLAARVNEFIEDSKKMNGSQLKEKYQTTGRQARAPRESASSRAAHTQSMTSLKQPSAAATQSNQQQVSQEPAKETAQQPAQEPAKEAAQEAPVQEAPTKEAPVEAAPQKSTPKDAAKQSAQAPAATEAADMKEVIKELSDRDKQDLEAALQSFWPKYDKDNNGSLDKAEIKLFFIDYLGSTDMDDAQFETAFKNFDTNGNGRIEKSEMANFLLEFNVVG